MKPEKGKNSTRPIQPGNKGKEIMNSPQSKKSGPDHSYHPILRSRSENHSSFLIISTVVLILFFSFSLAVASTPELTSQNASSENTACGSALVCSSTKTEVESFEQLSQSALQDRAQVSDSQQKEKSGEKQTDQDQSQEKEKKTQKLFQLEPVYVEVVDRVRENQQPNMTVVQTDLFPLTISNTLDTALERQPGVDVQRIQAIGTALDDDSVRIRGFGARRLLLLRDGRLLNSSGVAGGYFIDWTTVPLSSIARIEVLKGIADARYGNALGGIINLIPKRPGSDPSFDLKSGVASFGTTSFSAFHSWKPGAADYSLSTSFQDSNGYLRNGSFNLKNLELRFGYDLPWDGRLSTDLSYSRVKKGFVVFNRLSRDPQSPDYEVAADNKYPASDGEYMYGGMGAYPEPGAWWSKERLLLGFNYDQQLGPGGSLGLVRLNVWKNYGNREAYNTRTALNRVFHKKFYDDRSLGGGLEYRLPVFRSGKTSAETSQFQPVLLFGLDYAHLKDDGDTNYPDDFRAPFRNGYYVASKLANAYVQVDMPVFRPELVLTPGVRFMSYRGVSGPSGIAEGIPNISLSGLSPSLKLTFHTYEDVARAQTSLVYLSMARALRFPTPPEFYWHYDADDAGVDTSFLPFRAEDGLMLQAGWKYEIEARTRVEIAAYHYSIKNYIQFDLINFISYNIGKARVTGAEVEVARQLSRSHSLFANLTVINSRTEDDPLLELFVRPEDRDFNRIPGLPVVKGNLGWRWRTPGGLRIGGFLQAVGPQKVIYNRNLLWNDQLEVVEQKGYLRFDVEATYPLPKFKAEISGFVHNLFNAHYQERFGFPAAGRSAGLSLRFNL